MSICEHILDEHLMLSTTSFFSLVGVKDDMPRGFSHIMNLHGA